MVPNYALWHEFQSLLSSQLLLIIGGYLLVLAPAGIVVGLVLDKWDGVFQQSHQSLANAGKSIGILERLLILTFILIGQWSGVGFLLAAKSIFRFGDLRQSKDRKMTEYVMLGSLTSFATAIFIGIAVNAAIS
ncbi:hypothetical protein [Shewanella sp. NIFS-20-20]|uniref:hypothetical protein n=1 Tax=Shewanella sp. NIFS-20-20 TaxID=2853806 RepID=UPI001C436B66|nr:hypothetical protein [Shewanella sp. NIFS-20-20]MBV7315246.1 hypothetical protein [Shewanella sp. NIFS-20-20]